MVNYMVMLGSSFVFSFIFLINIVILVFLWEHYPTKTPWQSGLKENFSGFV